MRNSLLSFRTIPTKTRSAYMSRVRAVSLQISDAVAKGYHNLGVPSTTLSTTSTMGIISNSQNPKFGDYQCNLSMNVYSSLNKMKPLHTPDSLTTHLATTHTADSTDTSKTGKKKDKKKGGPSSPPVLYSSTLRLDLSNASTFPSSPANLSQGVASELSSLSDTPLENISVAPAGYLNFSVSEAFVADRLNAFFDANDAPRPLLLERDMSIVEATWKQRPISYPAGASSPFTSSSSFSFSPEDAPAYPRVMTIDYSSPNVAKEMHVGHIRSTCIGDALARIAEFTGFTVYRMNHLGDWGTQFGMLIANLQEELARVALAHPEHASNPLAAVSISDLQTFYRQAKKRFDLDEEFKIQAKANVVRLQSGDKECEKLWKTICEISRTEFRKTYDRLGVDPRLREFGESFYNPLLADVVEELLALGVAIRRNGAVLIPPLDISEVESSIDAVTVEESEKTEKGEEEEEAGALDGGAVVIVKTGGGYTYGTTDMAALRYRLLGPRLFNPANRTPEWDAMVARANDEISFVTASNVFDLEKNSIDNTQSSMLPADWSIYVVDSGQYLHFQRVMRGAQIAGWIEASRLSALSRRDTFIRQFDHQLRSFSNDVTSTSTLPQNVPELPQVDPMRLEHVRFGVVLGEDNKRLRTRAGHQIRLRDLLDESVTRSAGILRYHEDIKSRSGDISATADDIDETPEIVNAIDDALPAFTVEDLSLSHNATLKTRAEALGHSAVKYADLKKNRIHDYVFSFDAMLDLRGDTASYLIYAHARIFSLLQRASSLPVYMEHIPSLSPLSAKLDRSGMNTSVFDLLPEASREENSPMSLYQHTAETLITSPQALSLLPGDTLDVSRLVASALTQYYIAATHPELEFNAPHVTTNGMWVAENSSIGAQAIQELLSTTQVKADLVVNPVVVRDIAKSYAKVFTSPCISTTEKARITVRLPLVHESERALSLHILRFQDAILATTATMQPHVLCDYTQQLATKFSAFYRDCSVLNAAEGKAVVEKIDSETCTVHVLLGEKDARVLLTHATAITMRRALSLIGLRALKSM